MRPCHCGSGLPSRELLDGHNIYLCRVCDKCEAARLREFRPDVLDRYETDEQIEEVL